MEPHAHRRFSLSRILRGLGSRRAFTLVELLVTLAIMGVILTVALSGQGPFNSSLILTNTAYDVALSLRQAETFGIASRSFGATSNAGYGLEFSKNAPGSYVFYADVYPAPGAANNCHCASASCSGLPDAKPGNCFYDASYGAGSSELVSQYRFGRGIMVVDICGTDTSSGATHCSAAAPADLRSVDVVFIRPNTAATITAINNSGSTVPLASATIYLGVNEARRCIKVTAVGQVRVLPVCP